MDIDEIVYPVACGLDVHFAQISACMGRSGPKGGVRYEERRFPSTQRGLAELRDWLVEAGCEAVGMEATGVYWMPVYAALEQHVRLVVGNPQHMRNLRGHKTDRKDARWIAGLTRHGLIRPSYVPPPEFRDARELTRFRRQLVQSRSGIRNEVLRLLARQGIPLADVLSNVFGASGMAILEAMSEGRSVLSELKQLVHPSVRKKLAELAAALEAPLSAMACSLLVIQLGRLEAAEREIEKVEGMITQQLAKYRPQIELLMKIPGISLTSACILLAEIGVNMSIWPTEKHLAAWAGVSPGCRESGGKKLGSTLRKGNTHLTTALVECAGAAVKKKGCHLGGKFQRLRARMGYKKAIVAIARKLLLIVRRVLMGLTPYEEPQPRPMSERVQQKAIRRRVEELQKMGFNVCLVPA